MLKTAKTKLRCTVPPYTIYEINAKTLIRVCVDAHIYAIDVNDVYGMTPFDYALEHGKAYDIPCHLLNYRTNLKKPNR